VSSNNYNYPEITKGMGELTPAMWSRLMGALRYHEETIASRSAELQPESLNSRITDLEMYKPYFYAKLLRAKVLDTELLSPNTYAYAWCEVNPISTPTDCCEGCLTSRNGTCGNDPDDDCLPANYLNCCETKPNCLTYLNYQGLWNWWENTNNTSWGDTLANSTQDGEPIPWQFNTTDLKSDYNPLQFPCIKSNPQAPNCDPNHLLGGYPNINHIAYTKPAMNLLEAFNNSEQAGGVDQRFGIGDFMMQAIGGGDTVRMLSIGGENTSPAISPECWDSTINEPPCTQYEFALKSTPIVLMHNMRESDGTFRQVFQEANSYDGTCVTC